MIAILVMVLATISEEAGDPAAPPAAPPVAAPAAPAPPVPRAPPPPPARAPGAGFAPAPDVSLALPDLKRWYGWELMLSDAAFVTLASRSHWSGAGMIGAALGITIGTPLHAANGNGQAWM